ncbi:DUF3175 domain-containing protein [Marinobacter halodurans]|uniref:DUF3175 domain-containing protein n=1 Tax=Marinobacter halodurans TaxID=2528979 RepID=A0ABY1ZH24_9GAMM|nr:DUF3175 domain-containing protein [Marinobacter halodurans]TBW49117.1 DUF3175 domain-containing protein [Marinobacter halodurans]
MSESRKRDQQAAAKGWSHRVTKTSDALDLEEGVFTRKDPRAIAQSLKESAESSERRKSDPYRSAMSMLTFYLNRAGKNMPDAQRQVLEAAKDELRSLYGRPGKGSGKS